MTVRTTKLTCRGRLQESGVTENQYGGPGQVQRLVRRSPADASRYSLMLHQRVPLPGVDFLAAFFTFGGLTSS